MLTNQNIFIIKLFHRSLTIAISLSCTCFAAKCDRTFSKSQLQYSQYYEATSYKKFHAMTYIPCIRFISSACFGTLMPNDVAMAHCTKEVNF